MKKLLFIIIAFISMGIALSSCSKDDDNNTPSYSIVGVWQKMPDVWIYEFKADNTWYYYGYVGQYERNEPSKSGKYTFDGKYIVLDGGFKEEITFSENGKEIEWDGNYYKKIK